MSHHLPGSAPPQANHATKARQFAGQLAQSAGQAVQSWTVRKYTLPDKNVASQVLMYRQLLHTKCRPGLKLSREYQGTPAQVAVKHMPWWDKGMDETKKMVISYDSLIRRLWLHGAIYPYQAEDNTLLDEQGQPPIPHDFWVHRLGFQQPDPVTDFRSGGVLSLAMMVHLVESCPTIHERFVHGDACVLPFGITSINLTDMMAKFLMLARNVDRMDALLSQKPFWKMFADPNALLVCQELSMDMLADVVVELRQERQVFSNQDVTVFDFSFILEKTERRVEFDLLGAGPQNVEQLRAIHKRLKVKYQTQLEAKLARLKGEDEPATTTTTAKESVLQQASGLGAAASSFTQNVFSKIKAPGFTSLNKKPESSTTTSEATITSTPVTDSVLAKVAGGGTADDVGGSSANSPPQEEPSPTIVKIPDNDDERTAKPAAAKETPADNISDGDWADVEPVNDALSNFSIVGDEDEEEAL